MLSAFDTHAAFRKFTNVGISAEHAEAIISTIQSGMEADFSRLATREQLALIEKEIGHLKENMVTKAELAEVKAELKGEIANTRTEVKTEIANSKTEMLKWYFGMTIAQVSIIIAALKYFGH